ncbi:hypothetical protein GIB67_020461 [Kingdonia uniflora]|uniref:tRNA(His) guanylyltransferase n=1 Tax=Kingdonia uniflora TaxID=39325 RepID=A0A7J7LUW8_9MAGN|nr:hypothetical protein GIB67_020461 [Kingdonia uniflora]
MENSNKYKYVKSFEVEDKLLAFTWIVARIDGRHFHELGIMCIDPWRLRLACFLHEFIKGGILGYSGSGLDDDGVIVAVGCRRNSIVPGEAGIFLRSPESSREKLNLYVVFIAKREKHPGELPGRTLHYNSNQLFSDRHEFKKPNDEQALNLMNACAVAMLEEFPDIVFSYGVSDEYSFVFKKSTEFYQRRTSKIVSVIVSFFSSVYVRKWKDFFPQKELRSIPSFDCRAICYPSIKSIKDYLAWRQVDCHINNQYNTCFWMLVKSGKTKQEAQDILKGTQTQEKNELLFQLFDINYDKLPAIFRKGSCVFRDEMEETLMDQGGDPPRVVVDHCDIIRDSFWKNHPSILLDDYPHHLWDANVL